MSLPPHLPVDLGSFFDLENDLPDELIPNGDLGLMGLPSNGSAGTSAAATGMVPDAAAKHKQLSELLRAGSGSGLSGTINSVGPQLSALNKGLQPPAGSPTLPPQNQKQVPAPAGQNSAGLGLGAGFGQAHGLLGQNSQTQPGQVMNGSLGPTGRGRGGPGLQYQGQAMQGAPSATGGGAAGPGGGGAGPGGSGSVLAETLAQGAPQMVSHPGMNSQQAGNMGKVGTIGRQATGTIGRQATGTGTVLFLSEVLSPERLMGLQHDCG